MDDDQRLTDDEFRSLMEVLMCHDDPDSPADRLPAEALAEEEAVARGHGGWIEALHDRSDAEPAVPGGGGVGPAGPVPLAALLAAIAGPGSPPDSGPAGAGPAGAAGGGEAGGGEDGGLPDGVEEAIITVSEGECVESHALATDHRGRVVPIAGEDYPGGEGALLEAAAEELGWSPGGGGGGGGGGGRPGVHMVDFDNTLTAGDCRYWVDGEREEPNPEQIEETNARYRDGWCVVVWTARPWSEASTIAARLTEWGVRFHGVLCEKGSADEYVDDKAKKPAGRRGGGA